MNYKVDDNDNNNYIDNFLKKKSFSLKIEHYNFLLF